MSTLIWEVSKPLKGQCIHCNISWEGTIHHVLSVPPHCPTLQGFKLRISEVTLPIGSFSLTKYIFHVLPDSNAMLFSTSVSLPALLSGVFHPVPWLLTPTRPNHWPYAFLNNQTKGMSPLEITLSIHVPPLWIPFPSFVLYFFFWLMLLLLTVLFPLLYAPMGTRDTYTFASS